MTLWFIALAVLFTWPLMLHVKTAIIGEIGDNVYFIWMIGWMKKALTQLHVNPMNIWFLNYPQGWSLASTEIAPAQLALAFPFSLIGGETFAYNLTMLLSIVLSGWMMFGWVQHLTGSKPAALLSGTIYATLPYWQMHFLAGHLNLCGTQWLPLFFWGWADLLRPGLGEFRKKPALLAALGLGLTALTSQYYFFMMVFVAAVQALILLLFSQLKRLADRAFWKSMLMFLLAALPLLLLAELPFLMLAGSGGMPDRDWGLARMYSASPTDFFLPATNHFLLRNWVSAHFNRDLWIEGTLYIGIATFLLTLVGAFRKKKDEQWIWQFLWIGIITAVILALGTDLHWNGSPVEISTPSFLQRLISRERMPLFLPSFFLFRYFPFFAKLRALMRFGIFALLLFAVGAGFGCHAILERIQGKGKYAVMALLMAWVIFDFLPAPQTLISPIQPQPVDQWLNDQPAEGSVMMIPFALNDDQARTYATLTHNKPFLGGFFNAFPPDQYQRISSTMHDFPTETSVELARSLRVAYIVVDRHALEQAAEAGGTWSSLAAFEAACEAFGLRETYRDEDFIVYDF